MHGTDNRIDFEKALERQGMSAVFRTNDEGRIYGATFIDHEQKCVFNGSRLGREYSANVFNSLFNGTEGHSRTVEEQPDRRIGQSRQSSELPDNAPREKENGAGLGGLFDLFSPGSDATDNIAEQAFLRRLKKKNKRQRRM
jgi:hypothetical protein